MCMCVFTAEVKEEESEEEMRDEDRAEVIREEDGDLESPQDMGDPTHEPTEVPCFISTPPHLDSLDPCFAPRGP